MSASDGGHATVFHCPYCGEEDLHPHQDGHGAWWCRGCSRVFSVRFVGTVVGTVDDPVVDPVVEKVVDPVVDPVVETVVPR